MRHVLSFLDHALRGTSDLLSWYPSPEVQFLGRIAGNLVRSEAVRTWVRITARTYWTGFTARLGRRNRKKQS
jgi:hypothetical protein